MRGAGRVNKRKVAWSYLDLQTNSIKEVSYRFPCTACTRHFLNHATIGFSIEGVSNCQLNKKNPEKFEKWSAEDLTKEEDLFIISYRVTTWRDIYGTKYSRMDHVKLVKDSL